VQYQSALCVRLIACLQAQLTDHVTQLGNILPHVAMMVRCVLENLGAANSHVERIRRIVALMPADMRERPLAHCNMAGGCSAQREFAIFCTDAVELRIKAADGIEE